MSILRKNQIIILVIALMLVSAGYLNYTSNKSNEVIPTSGEENKIEYAGIGDAKLVSSNNVIEQDENISNEETITTSNKAKEIDQYFSSSRLNRETMYSQMIETYQKILENDSISEDQKTIAQTEIQNINNTKNKIMICENLIKTKEIQDLIIFVNDKSISVVVKIDKLEQEQIAQIQNIITREMQTDIENIHISNK